MKLVHFYYVFSHCPPREIRCLMANVVFSPHKSLTCVLMLNKERLFLDCELSPDMFNVSTKCLLHILLGNIFNAGSLIPYFYFIFRHRVF